MCVQSIALSIGLNKKKPLCVNLWKLIYILNVFQPQRDKRLSIRMRFDTSFAPLAQKAIPYGNIIA